MKELNEGDAVLIYVGLNGIPMIDYVTYVDKRDTKLPYRLKSYLWVSYDEVDKLTVDNNLNRKLYPNYIQYDKYLVPADVVERLKGRDSGR